LNVIITGASRGIGRELLNRYLKKGAKVYAIARDVSSIENLDGVEAIALDLSDLEAVERLSKRLSDKNIEVIICNAAISLPHSPNFTPFEDFKKTIDINFLSVHALLSHIVPNMKSGKIVLISSLASLVGAPTSMPYSASKRALNSYAESLRNLLAPDIEVINILPGFIKTDMTAKNNFYMPFLMELEEGVDRIEKAIQKGKKVYAFPKQFYYIIKLFNLLPVGLRDKILQKVAK